MSDPQAALAAATLAMTVVKNEANDNYGTWTWTVEQGAARFLEVMRNKGYALTPLAPEVPPRSHDALYGQTIRSFDGHASVPTPLPAETPFSVAATRTPEPPDSGDGAARCSECGVPIAEHPDTDACAVAAEPRDAGIDAALTEIEAIDPADFESKASVLVEVRAILRARLRSGSPAPEGGE